MAERKTTNFIPKWARDGKWELADFPQVGYAGEPDEPDPKETGDAALLAKCRRILLELERSDTQEEFWAVAREAKPVLAELDARLTPPAPTPIFAIGDPVWSFNGEPRVVTGMKWDQAMRRMDEPFWHEPQWCWFLDTVHPDDPTCKGCGAEEMYARREVEEE